LRTVRGTQRKCGGPSPPARMRPSLGMTASSVARSHSSRMRPRDEWGTDSWLFTHVSESRRGAPRLLKHESGRRQAGLLTLEFSFKCGFAFGDGGLVAGGIDPDLFAFAGLHAREFGWHLEVLTVRAEEDVAGEGLERREGVAIVVGDAGVGGFVAGLAGLGGLIDEAVAGVDVPTANDDDVLGFAVEGGLEGPGGAAAGVAGGLMRSEGDAAESDLVVVMQDAVDMGACVELCGVGEVGFAAGLGDADVAVHDHVLRVGHAEDFGAAAVMVPMA